ncbi:MAG: ATP synthase F1 subunit delta [Ignavibacteria bacterium]|jgi:F-type H+-transporting ATPase subunit delta|nr:ATP synthase F1 subunit delta [Ignavibacteria bacterium]MDH7526765.1 ATP synthase F1 subunit delta [Ignavibacteria bacterium]
MLNTKVTNRYAKALLDLAVSENLLDVIVKDLEFVQNNILSLRELFLLIKSPIVKRDKKRKIFAELFKDKISETSLKFCELIINRQRSDLLLDIIKRFLQMKDEYLNIKSVLVRSAFELDEKHINELKSVLENNLGKKVNINLLIDKNLLGGFIVQIDDTLIDASLKHQLELLRKKFLFGTEKLN